MEKKVFKRDQKFVYVIKNEETGRVKIGITSDIKQRFSILITGSGCKMKLVHLTKRIDNAREIERLAHEHFSEKHYIGEWFNINSEEAVIYLNEQKENFIISVPKIINVECNGKYQRKIHNKKEVIVNEYEFHKLNYSLTQFDKIGKNLFLFRRTGEKYFIKYINRNWMAKKIHDDSCPIS